MKIFTGHYIDGAELEFNRENKRCERDFCVGCWCNLTVYLDRHSKIEEVIPHFSRDRFIDYQGHGLRLFFDYRIIYNPTTLKILREEQYEARSLPLHLR